MKKGVLLVLLFAIVFVHLSIVSADLSVSMGPRYANSSQSTLYNFTIQDTSSSGVNFTQVNISVPSGFSIIGSSNGTSSISPLSISGSTLSWTNSSGVVFAGSHNFFWFNATDANSIGQFNFTVTSLDTSSNINSTKINITLSDITSPSASFDNSVTPANNSKLNRTYIPVEITASDNVAVDNVSITLYSSTGSILNASNVKSSPFLANFTNLSNGNYSVQATVFDTSGNVNITSVRYVMLNFTQISTSSVTPVTCVENWTCISWGTCNNVTKKQSCLTLSDVKHCGTNLTKPSNRTQECNPNVNCIANCTDWTPSPCTGNETQTMTCTYPNNCSSTKFYNQTCTSSPTGNDSSSAGKSSFPMAFIIVIVFVIGSIIAVVVILVKLKKKSYSSDNFDFGNEDELGRPKTY